VPRAAPRISHRLLERLEALDDGNAGFGDLTRQLGEEAVRLGLPRPSYQQVRVLAQRHRSLRRAPGTVEVLLDVATRARPVDAVVDHAAGTLPPRASM